MADDHKAVDTGEYSATKAPENREHVESKWQSNYPQKPGGPHGAPSDVGMSGFDPEMARNQAEPDKNGPHATSPVAPPKDLGVDRK
jgi:hypothetical protein